MKVIGQQDDSFYGKATGAVFIVAVGLTPDIQPFSDILLGQTGLFSQASDFTWKNIFHY